MAETTGKIKFDVTQEHRTGGNGATYILKNYKNAIEHPDFQQAIEMGNAFGYRGHPRRKVLNNGKLTYEPVLFPHETEAVPTHVCTYAAMEGKYCIHEQKFLTGHEEGRIVKSLWDGNTGGFSSRASTIGGYGGRYFPTKLARMAGMDFVHDRSYRYNAKSGVIATESVMHELSVEYLVDELGVAKKPAHFICNGGTCPNPTDLALEQAVFQQVMDYEISMMEHELALEDAHKIAVESAYRKGFEEKLENEKNAFRAEIEEFQETFGKKREEDLAEAESIAIEYVRKMSKKPYFEEGFYTAIAPSLIKNGTDRVAIESTFYDLIKPFTGYTPADFVESKDEFVNVSAENTPQPVRYHRTGDRMLIPRG